MPRRRADFPAYLRHKPTNQALCRVRLANGALKSIYLGPWRSAASKAEYARVIALVAANGGTFPSATADLSLNEALARYARHVNGYYYTPALLGIRWGDRLPKFTLLKGVRYRSTDRVWHALDFGKR